ncbi:lysylphosphatidylglycerol synthase transmembrane domain-containing protein [Natronoarchaeum rubrum]|uniref:lysylphosphatidylglycerol synthase transmembrane domain-containing protein n=1 Tax=Natronoarchaeum rubrum TaxID=755311 RepID=UPI00211138F9|nr:lysylphosphatidylglycerol synthase transmembrane domain-containing protein [Natronoarchaeum rubrum]
MAAETRLDRRSILVGFVGAGLVLSALLWLVGIDGIVAQLRRARPAVIAILLGLIPLWLVAWGLCLHTVLRAMGTPTSRRRSVVVFTAATFANQVTPFGQAGGEPISAFLISEAADTEYENGLAAIASVDTLHFFPSIGMGVVGIGLFVLRGLDFGRNLLLASVTVAALLAGFVLALTLGWRFRDRVEATVLSVLPPIIRRVGRTVPRVSAPTREEIKHRVDGFFASIARIASNRRLLIVAGLFSCAGWLTLAICLWISLASIGVTVPFVAVLVVLPVASTAGIFPLPGGMGGVEGAFIVLVVATTGVATTAATAAVVIYRGATYWLPMLVGGGIAAVIVDNLYRGQ